MYMAYKRYGRSSMPGKRRQKKTVEAKADQALVIAKKANKKELKYHDVSTGATLMIPTGAGFLTAITSLAQGSGSNQRIGNAIEAKSIHLRLSSLYNPLATASSQLYRIIVFQNLLTGTAANILEYLQSASFYSMKSIDNRFNTKTMFDKTYSVSNDNAQRNHNIRLKIPKNIYYPNATSTPEKNAVCIFVISNETTAVNAPFLEGQGRFFFTE